MQLSDWEYRPLSNEQMQYAALDAYVLILLYKIKHESNTNTITNTVSKNITNTTNNNHVYCDGFHIIELKF